MEIIGAMLMIEDISSEKRMKSTMSRYMDPELADQLMTSGASNEEIMGGKQSVGTVLFSDVRVLRLLQKNWEHKVLLSC